MRSRILLAAVAVLLIVGAGWYLGQTREPLERSAVIERAMAWTEEGVPYSQTEYKDGYRRDCSGFVSMAWNLPENVTTWRIPLVAKEISKDELKPGDVLLDFTSRDRHVVIFEKWANAEKTRYWALESSGNPDIMAAVRRVVPYPYVVNRSHYRPYRYESMDDYWDELPKDERQPVSGYKGREVGSDG